MSIMSEHGVYYVHRDGERLTVLDQFLAKTPTPEARRALPRPERDVLLALLRFCVEGIEHMNIQEMYGLIEPTTLARPDGSS